MTRFARWCFVHRRSVLAGWLLAVVVVLGLSGAVGTRFNSNFSLPSTDSAAAVALLKANFPTASGEGDLIVIQATGGATVQSPSVKSAVTEALVKVAKVPGVAAVDSPYATQGSPQISRDGTVAFAPVTWDQAADKVTITDAKDLIAAAESADGPNTHISLSGQSISSSQRASVGASVAVGLLAALAILLIVFGGALFSALMPLLAAIVALVVGISVIGLLTHVFDVASESTDLAVLIGLGVGVDYGLFIISRHRSGVKAGMSYEDAAAQAVNTSGRTVLFAGLTVCIALLGQFVLGVGFLYGLAASAAIAVALTMATSLTLLPAMLGFLGPKVLSRRERKALAHGVTSTTASPFWSRWAKFVEVRKTLVAVGALAIVVVVALPIFGLRLGSSDASTDPSTSTTHQAYVALAQGFGPGFNGPLQLVGQVTSPADVAAFDDLVATAAHAAGVATVTSPVTSPNGKVLLATVYPTSSPQATQTVALVNNLRHDLIPRAEQGTGLTVHVGGVTATNIDFSHVLTDKLPLFIAIVVMLGFLLLTAVFRSLLIPLVASVMNLLSIGAALGAMNAVFNWGWGRSVLGLTGTGPVDVFIPVLMFSVLFGLSMDYEVYLMSRIQEEWRRRLHSEQAITAGLKTRGVARNHRAITIGQGQSGAVIAAAAAIMVMVFGSFIPGGQRALAEFGFGLGFSVLVDAFVIRSLLVPAVHHLIGPANWYMPTWLDRILPNLSVEAEDLAQLPLEEHPAPVLVGADVGTAHGPTALAVPPGGDLQEPSEVAQQYEVQAFAEYPLTVGAPHDASGLS
jgi:putative drug exporter of the RND superfamily